MGRSDGRPYGWVKAEIIRCHGLGMTSHDIVTRCGIKLPTIYYFCRELGIKLKRTPRNTMKRKYLDNTVAQCETDATKKP